MTSVGDVLRKSFCHDVVVKHQDNRHDQSC